MRDIGCVSERERRIATAATIKLRIERADTKGHHGRVEQRRADLLLADQGNDGPSHATEFQRRGRDVAGHVPIAFQAAACLLAIPGHGLQQRVSIFTFSASSVDVRALSLMISPLELTSTVSPVSPSPRVLEKIVLNRSFGS